jgi:class 3 adenylate cyclase/pimeloyl-ACP methyl ester carboxylesterase
VRYVTVDDVSIAYQVRGHGPLDVVYVPGLLNLIEATDEEPALARHVDRMTEFSRLVLFDKRGTGLSDRVSIDEMTDGERRLDDLSAVMDAVGLEAAVLFAQADGTAIAMQFAARHPERVRGLVLWASSARMVAADGYEPGLPAEMALPREVWLERWGNDDHPMALELLAPSVEDDPRWRATLARMERRSATPRAAHAYWETTRYADVRGALAGIRAPTLVLHAGDDRLVPVAQGRYVAGAIAGASYVEVPGGEHFFWFQHGDTVTQHVEEFLTGGRRQQAGGRRLATVVFADIVGSTEIAGRLGDARWRDLLESHDRLVRRDLRRFGGQEVKFTGDGFLALFDTPDAAVDCAAATIAAMASLQLELRVGVHTGTVEMRSGDVAGIAVHVAARLLGHAAASEIVVTRTVKDLLAGGGRMLEPLGRHSLKGVDDEWELYRLVS